MRKAVDAMLARKGTALLALSASLAIQAFFVLQNVVLGAAMGIHVPLAAWFVAFTLSKLASLTPISVGGIGVREGVMASLLAPFGVPAGLSVAASLVWQSIMLSLGIVGGILSLWISRRQTGALHPEKMEASVVPD